MRSEECGFNNSRLIKIFNSLSPQGQEPNAQDLTPKHLFHTQFPNPAETP